MIFGVVAIDVVLRMGAESDARRAETSDWRTAFVFKTIAVVSTERLIVAVALAVAVFTAVVVVRFAGVIVSVVAGVVAGCQDCGCHHDCD
jgi:hypothetical protein